jgi:hypothetical protein
MTDPIYLKVVKEWRGFVPGDLLIATNVRTKELVPWGVCVPVDSDGDQMKRLPHAV